MTTSNMAKKTLTAGIIVGAVGLIGVLFGTQIITSLYDNPSLLNDGYYFLNAAISAVISFCLPLSAALIAASLVMRHTESLTAQHHDPVEATDTRY
jgi:Na+-driven multidrug efflux pump